VLHINDADIFSRALKETHHANGLPDHKYHQGEKASFFIRLIEYPIRERLGNLAVFFSPSKLSGETGLGFGQAA
jgi:hypothetical protein